MKPGPDSAGQSGDVQGLSEMEHEDGATWKNLLQTIKLWKLRSYKAWRTRPTIQSVGRTRTGENIRLDDAPPRPDDEAA
jgi:hypothetical protein